jgi:hypothetical protein
MFEGVDFFFSHKQHVALHLTVQKLVRFGLADSRRSISE